MSYHNICCCIIHNYIIYYQYPIINAGLFPSVASYLIEICSDSLIVEIITVTCSHFEAINHYILQVIFTLIVTEGALRIPMTYDDHPSHPIRPTYSSEWTRGRVFLEGNPGVCSSLFWIVGEGVSFGGATSFSGELLGVTAIKLTYNWHKIYKNEIKRLFKGTDFRVSLT